MATETKFGIGQLKNPSPTWAKTIANTAIILCGITSVIVAPMPDEWVSIVVSPIIQPLLVGKVDSFTQPTKKSNSSSIFFNFLSFELL